MVNDENGKCQKTITPLPSVLVLDTGCVVAHREIVSSLGLQMLFSRALR